MSQEKTVVYFEERGKGNTDETLRLARARADALGIEHVVVASYSGETGAKASEAFKGRNVVVAAGVVGFREPNTAALTEDNLARIEANGAKVFFAGHAFGMVGRAVREKFGAMQVEEVVANVLRLFSAGVKVGCEIACMAVDAGLVPSGSEAIAIAGSAQGADTAIVVRTSNTHRFFDTRVLEIICKPRG